MLMMGDLMKEMGALKEANDKLQDQIGGLDLDDLNKRLKSLEDLQRDMNLKLALLPAPEEFDSFVRWQQLEEAMLGIRSALDDLQKPVERIVMESFSQTDAKPESRPTSSRSRPSSSLSGGPSPELLEILERLGHLSSDFGELMKRVKSLETEMPNKLDKSALDGLNLSDDILNQLNKLKDDIHKLQSGLAKADLVMLSSPHNDSKTISLSPPPFAESQITDTLPQWQPPPADIVESDLPNPQPELQDSDTDIHQTKVTSENLNELSGGDEELKAQLEELLKRVQEDEEAVNRLRQMLLQLEKEVEKLNKTTHELTEDNLNKKKKIEELFGLCEELERRKADKEYVAMEVDVKADKRQLEGKVNHSLFDSTTSEINKTIKDILDKLSGNDAEWKSMLAKLANDLDGKLDRLELTPLKEWLEAKLKALSKKIQDGQLNWTEDEAAGLRRQLIQRYHCLSCDKPVDVMPKGFGTPDVADFYATTRQCGGSHTLTYPNKRLTRMNNFKEEVDVLGADGHIYKGRMDATGRLEAKIPSPLAQNRQNNAPQSPTYTESKMEEGVKSYELPELLERQTPRSGQRPMSARGPQVRRSVTPQRPGSRQEVSRPQSARPSSSNPDQRSGHTTPQPSEEHVYPEGEEETGEITVEVPSQIPVANAE
ncbi:hypothetical protein BaRGS_00001990 [Batillaria attramentaria]|uniref:DUF4795 domain-containing protein n=1 Tax=Batillaria attramentaria TaxID=370345 RepID=A0ABD0M4D0_9CAEN